MAVPRVSIQIPPGSRACGGQGPNTWTPARDASGTQAFMSDIEFLKTRFATGESRAVYMDYVQEYMDLAQAGGLAWDLVTQMQIAQDVLEIRLPDWYFSGGKMHVRLYFSEPRELPGHLVALRLRTKRPGPLGVEEQDGHAVEASDLLLKFRDRGFQ